MPRPKRPRFVGFEPGVTYFKPRGIPLSLLEEVDLTVDELEALRLADFEGLDQIKAAKKMKVSQSTFQRILTSARKKIAEALVKGKALRIEGGEFRMVKQPARQFKCEDCGNIWKVPFGTGKRGIEMKCPKCGSGIVHRVDFGGHGFGRMPWGYKKK
ncbi:MAG: DUF134 domain-containing protein [Patescibacteria group bacterium]